MIAIGLGANIPGLWGAPCDTLRKTVALLNRPPFSLLALSRFIRTPPFGDVAQPEFINAAALVRCPLRPEALLRRLLAIEVKAGRRRNRPWGPRPLDLDLLDYHGWRLNDRAGRLILPHPGIAQRRFVLEPLAEIAPYWRHPVLNQTATQLLAGLA